MRPSSIYSPANITHAGRIAHECLAPGQRGKVLAVFSKAIYLLTEGGELFWIATEHEPMHQRCARIPSPLSRPSIESPFRVADHHLKIDPGFVFELDNVSLWSAPHVDQVLELTSLYALIHSFFSNLDISQPEGFGSFIPHILYLSRIESINPSLESTDPILLFALPLVLDMARACKEHQPSCISQIADKLIGLGAGLTPSGDDFLGGLLFAINHLQAAYPHSDFTHYKISIERYGSRTHWISFTLLEDHANGYAIETLHHIINGILGGEHFEGIYPFVSQLTQIGHSTGWDLLAGLLTGLLITYQGEV